MRVVAMIPFWSKYQPVTNGLISLPLISIGGKSLILRTIEIIKQVSLIDEVVIFSSDNNIMKHVGDKEECSFLKRDKSLDSDSTSIEDIIDSFLSLSKVDIVVLVHPKSPFLKPETVEECINQVMSRNFDSAFTASSIRKHLWYLGEPLNYSRNKDTPPVSKIEPIIVETSSVYVFTKNLFKTTRKRIGEKPYVKEIGHFEGFEIERDDDFKMAELIINSGLDREKITWKE
jgi:CMP-N-acetylneuraminic acid synthetase